MNRLSEDDIDQDRYDVPKSSKIAHEIDDDIELIMIDAILDSIGRDQICQLNSSRQPFGIE